MSVKDFLLDLVFPISCIGCQKKETWLCESCFHMTHIVLQNVCRSCHAKYTVGKLCPLCDQGSYLDGVYYLTSFEERISKTLLHYFIQTNAKPLKQIVNTMMASYISLHQLCFDDYILTFIPLHSFRKRLLGHDASEEFAHLIEQSINIPVSKHLSQYKWIPLQKKVPIHKRLNNVRKAYTVQGDVRDKRILLIDTMIMTGSTLQECARILKEKGAKEVKGMAFIRSQYLT